MKNLFFLLLFIEAAAFGQNFDESWIIRNIQEDNSKSNDYQPFMVDSIMIFTSDRGGKNKAYFSTWKHGTYEMRKDDYKWTLLNSSTTLVGTNDTHFFFRKNNDFYQAEKKDNPEKPWKIHRIKKLKNLNSDKDEQSLVCVNDTFYFSSKRNGSYNIYMKVGTGKENPVVPLDSLNSSYDEVDIFLSPDGQHLFFSSDRPGGIGGFDIYKSTKVSGVWGKPELLPKPINSFMSDRGFKAYNDTCIVFYSDRITRENAGKFDLYDVKKSYYATLSYRDSSERKIVVDKVHSEKKEELIPSDTSSVMEENPFVKKAKQVLEREIPVGEVFTDNTPIQEEPKIFKQEIPETVQQEIPKTIKDKQNHTEKSFRAEVQIGAYQYITSVEEFKNKVPCIKDEPLRMVVETMNGVIIHKFVLDKIFDSLDDAIASQNEMIEKVCLPRKDKHDKAFIALLDNNNKRYGLFFNKDAYLSGKIIYLSS